MISCGAVKIITAHEFNPGKESRFGHLQRREFRSRSLSLSVLSPTLHAASQAGPQNQAELSLLLPPNNGPTTTSHRHVNIIAQTRKTELLPNPAP